MTAEELLTEVKKSLNITGSFQDEALKNHIYEVLEYLSDAGVSDAVLKSDAVIGIVARGVSDLWNYGAGGTELSPYFMQRAIQLAYKQEELMSARSLLNSADAESTLLSLRQSTPYFVIDGDKQTITPPVGFTHFGVESDENSRRVWFECPKIVGDGLDLTKLNVRVIFQNANKQKDQYIVTDVVADGGMVHFSWLLSRKCTLYSGALVFIVCVTNTGADGTIVNEWNTTLCSGQVLVGLEVDEPEITEDVTDVVSQLLDLVKEAVAEVGAKSAAAVEQVQAAEAAALLNIANSIDPTLSINGKASDSGAVGAKLETKADAIIVSAEGETIAVHDSANSTIKGLRIFGRTAQNGIPAPDAPVELVSVENPVVSVFGKNLLNIDQMLNEQLVKNADGTYTLTKNGSGSLRFSNRFVCHIPKGVYALSVGSVSGTEDTVRVALTYSNGSELASALNLNGTKIINATDDIVKIGVYIPADRDDGTYTTFTGLMMESGDAVTAYEKYRDFQSLVLPYVLHGIPVESGGNHTDANGQQWICDEIDLERGVYVQRVAAEILATVTHYNEHGIYVTLAVGKSKYDTIFVCSRFAEGVAYANGQKGAYASCVLPKSKLPAFVTSIEAGQVWINEQAAAGTPVVAVYALSEIIETPLSDAEIAAVKELHSNRPNTTLLNDQSAHMLLKYSADIEEYITTRYVPVRSFIELVERVSKLEEG